MRNGASFLWGVGVRGIGIRGVGVRGIGIRGVGVRDGVWECGAKRVEVIGRNDIYTCIHRINA